jgi:4-diphosphocytidyl-2-C-methyl-D-erythritol kinase
MLKRPVAAVHGREKKNTKMHRATRAIHSHSCNLRVQAFAKINLGLRILGRRPDGYHLLETVMQTIDLADELELEPGENGLNFYCDDPALRQDNLVVKAALAFYRKLGLSPAVTISLSKRIPYGSGLGGGSSDAAAALRGLNFLHGNILSRGELWETARGLGADVPFFLCGGRALCTGIGDIITPLAADESCYYLLVKPPFSLASGAVYALWDQHGSAGECRADADSYLPKSKTDIRFNFINDLEAVVHLMYKDLAGVKKELYKLGAEAVSMSGSGSTMFAVFVRAQQAQRAENIMKSTKPGNWWIKSCQGTPAAG